MADQQQNEKSLFLAALEINSEAERAAFLKDACEGNPQLQAQVDSLLQAHVKAQPILDAAPSPDAPVDPSTVERAGAVIGPYKLIEQIGEGGMGTVWMAQQTTPVKRTVALKLIKEGMDSRLVVARFEAERQALALMDHANICRVLDAGATSAGRPYFVMDLVKGVPITRYCDENRLTPRQRLELFVPVCQAVQHAHQKGVIHRDLKPSNVLVALYDGKPAPKVIDFGVAKATEQSLTERTLVTGFGAIVGTLDYMSPEQAEFNQLDVDTRSDVYSLGVLLYELLAGSPPFTRKELEGAGLLEMLRVIREQEPSKPSTKLSTSEGLPSLAASRGTEPTKLTRQLCGELDWIVMKALEKDRNRRYETANGFAQDVQRYLADEPVLAGPPSAWYRVRKFARRNKGPVLAAASILFVLVAGITGTTFGLVREAAQRKIADAEKKKAEQAEADTLADYRASTDDAIEQLIGSKSDLGPQERAYLEKTLKRWQAFAARQGDDERSQAIRAEGHRRLGYLWQKLGRREEARVEYETARDLCNLMAAAYPTVPEYLHLLATVHGNLGVLLRDLGQDDAARAAYETARDVHQKLASAFPAVALHQQLLASTHLNLGLLLRDLGQRNAARAEYETARDLQKKLVAAFPDVPRYRLELAGMHNSLGVLLYDLGQRDAARAEFETVRDLQKELVAAFPAVPEYQQELAKTHHNLAVLLNRLGQRDAALKVFEAALDLQKKLVTAFPVMPQYQQNLSKTHHNLAVLLVELGQLGAARTQFESARDLRKRLVAAFPTVPNYQRDLAHTHNSLGLLLRHLSQPAAARAEYTTAHDLQQKLATAYPAVPEYQEELAGTHNNLGLLLTGLGQHDAARKEFESARNVHQKLATAFPAVPDYQINLGASYCNFGILVRGAGQAADSLHWFDLAIRTLAPVYDRDRRAVTAKAFLRNSHVNRARAYDRLRKHAEAVKDWDRTVELTDRSEQAAYRAGRAYSRLLAGYTAEAVAEVAELTKAPNCSSDQWYDFACVYAVASSKIAEKKQQYADRAMELLRQAIQAGYKNAAHMAEDADLAPLRPREDFKKLLAELNAQKK
jgi:serine/threonine protein kinase/tetratricopeptide (TPR) repeat protein